MRIDASVPTDGGFHDLRRSDRHEIVAGHLPYCHEPDSLLSDRFLHEVPHQPRIRGHCLRRDATVDVCFEGIPSVRCEPVLPRSEHEIPDFHEFLGVVVLEIQMKGEPRPEPGIRP